MSNFIRNLSRKEKFKEERDLKKTVRKMQQGVSILNTVYSMIYTPDNIEKLKLYKDDPEKFNKEVFNITGYKLNEFQNKIMINELFRNNSEEHS